MAFGAINGVGHGVAAAGQTRGAVACGEIKAARGAYIAIDHLSDVQAVAKCKGGES